MQPVPGDPFFRLPVIVWRGLIAGLLARRAILISESAGGWILIDGDAAISLDGRPARRGAPFSGRLRILGKGVRVRLIRTCRVARRGRKRLARNWRRIQGCGLVWRSRSRAGHQAGTG